MSANSEMGLGVVKLDSGYSVGVWAPNAKEVYVRGDFNQWQEPGVKLTSEENGNWYTQLTELQNGQQYQFTLVSANGDTLLRNDPRSRLLTNSDGVSIVYDDDFDWGEDNFTLASWNKLVIYELHIGTFNRPESEDVSADEAVVGTFASTIEKLDYLADLGVNCIEIMPVNEFAGDYSWGYNPAYPFAVEEAYGGPNGLKNLVKEAHKRNIGVVLDVVYNHFGPSDLHLWQFDGWSENDKGGIYFYNDWKSDTPWGDTRPDYGRQEVCQYIFDNAMMWLDEFRLDGLRMDMIPYMRSVSGGEDPNDAIKEAYDLIRWINAEAKSRFPHKLMIAEDLHSNGFITDDTKQGGLGYGAQWDADFVHPIRNVLTQPDDNSRDLSLLQKALMHRYNEQPFSRIIYVESHDEVANGQARLAEEIAPGNVDEDYFARHRSVIGAALTLTSPGIPMLFQGQELLEDLWFDDTDPLDWSRVEQFPQLQQAYQHLIKLRKNEFDNSEALSLGSIEFIHVDHDNKIVAYQRSNPDKQNSHVLVVVNLKNQPINDYQIDGLQSQHWQCLFNWNEGYHKAEEFCFAEHCTKENFKFNIGAYQVLIFSEKQS